MQSSLIPTALEALQRYECLAHYHHAGCILALNVPAAPLHLVPFVCVRCLCGLGVDWV